MHTEINKVKSQGIWASGTQQISLIILFASSMNYLTKANVSIGFIRNQNPARNPNQKAHSESCHYLR